jgi:hypothetical protein
VKSQRLAETKDGNVQDSICKNEQQLVKPYRFDSMRSAPDKSNASRRKELEQTNPQQPLLQQERKSVSHNLHSIDFPKELIAYV